jgi:hypothetical protein
MHLPAFQSANRKPNQSRPAELGHCRSRIAGLEVGPQLCYGRCYCTLWQDSDTGSAHLNGPGRVGSGAPSPNTKAGAGPKGYHFSRGRGRLYRCAVSKTRLHFVWAYHSRQLREPQSGQCSGRRAVSKTQCRAVAQPQKPSSPNDGEGQGYPRGL